MTTQHLEKIRILAVDDDPVIRGLYKKILTGSTGTQCEMDGCEDLNVTCIESQASTSALPNTMLVLCETGEDALKVMAHSRELDAPFQIILMDVRLGKGIDGIQTAARLRRMDPAVQIIIVTGYSDYDTTNIQDQVPPRDKLFYLQKPFQYQEILQFCTSLYAKWRTEQAMLDTTRFLERRVRERTRDLRDLNIQLEELSRRFQTAFYASPAMMAISRVDNGEFIEVNAAFTKTLGYSESELYGRNHRDINLFDETAEEQINEALTTENVLNDHEVVLVAKSGKRLDVLMSVEPIEINRETYNLTVMMDISHRKRAERQERLARERAESANRSKSAFLATMSHEMRTPLNAIIGMTELVMDTTLDDEQRHYISLVQSSSDSLLTLINDILDFSKIEAGRMDLDPIPFNLQYTLRDIIQSYRPQANSKGLALDYDISEDIGYSLIGDVGRLRQILVNLISNAVKFTESGEVGVDVKVKEDGPSVNLHFAVRDTGIGIDDQKQPEIFAPFRQADGSTTRKYGGTGLGLAICQKLADLMGGRIWVESKIGVGSTFHLELTFPKEFSIQAQDSDNLDLSGQPALLVCDDMRQRSYLVNALAPLKLDITLANTPVEAMNRLATTQARGQRTAAVIIDFTHDANDPFELAGDIRQKGCDQRCVVMICGNGSRGDARLCKEMKVDVFLDKPVVPELLTESLIRGLGRSENAPKQLITKHSLKESHDASQILIAEDNEFNRMILIAMLEKAGYQVLIAKDGLEALDIIENRPVDLLVTDIEMPNLSGTDLIQRIRQRESESGNHLPIVVLSAYAMPGEFAQYREVGADDCLPKPTKKSQLITTISRWLSNSDPAANQQGDKDSAPESQKAATQPTPSVEDTITHDSSIPGDQAKPTLVAVGENGDSCPPQSESEQDAKNMVLIVDDVDENLSYMQRIMAKLGHDYIVAHNGQEAVDAVHANPDRISLILMDIQMPVMDGFEATAEIRKLTVDKQHIPIIALTASLSGNESRTCKKADMDGYYPKPIRPNQVIEIVNKWLPKKSA